MSRGSVKATKRKTVRFRYPNNLVSLILEIILKAFQSTLHT